MKNDNWSAPAVTAEVIAAEIRQGIYSGRLKPGDRLPAEAKLAKQRSVNRLTVTRAYGKLVNEGLIVSEPRRGYHVRYDVPMAWLIMRGALPGDPWWVSLQEYGLSGAEQITVEIVPADVRVTARYGLDELLGLGEDERAIARHAVRSLQVGDSSIPVEVSTAFYPEAIARGTALDGHDPLKDPHRVLAELGHPVTRVRHEIIARMPTPGEREEMDLRAPTPVQEVVSVAAAADGPIEARVAVYAAGPDRRLIAQSDPAPPEPKAPQVTGDSPSR